MKKPAWSHSSLKDFEGCARRYHEVKVLKNYPFQETEATRYGNQVHEALELYIKENKPIPPEYAQFKDVADAMLGKPGRKLAEHEMALTADLKPCEWKSPDVWVRGIADILIVDHGVGGRLEDRQQQVPGQRPACVDVADGLRAFPAHPQGELGAAVHS
jgi:hypothetical protein